MKRKFVNAILFGALIAASTSVVQSCKDYDDDIDNLQTEITTSAEDLTSLIDEKVANVQKEITSLESQIPALEEAYKAADAALNTAIENATNDAKGYADIQAAEAQTAAIAAAQNAVEQAKSELQASLDAANKIIDEQGKTVSSLLDADKALTSGIEAAQAQADKAYALAEQASKTAAENKAEIETLSANLGKINETLEAQITLFSEQISDILATANQNKADIEAQEAALAQVKADNEKALQALSNEDAELKKLIEANQTSIETTQKDIEELKKSVADNLAAAQLYAESLVKAAKEELQSQIGDINADIETLEGIAGTNATDIATLKTQYSTLEGKINDLKTEFAAELQDAINGVNGEITDLGLVVDGVKTDLQALTGRVDVAEDDIEYLKEALEKLLGTESGEGGDTGEEPGTSTGGTIEALEGKIDANKTAIDTINSTIESINEYLNMLNNNLANLITSIIVQETKFDLRYGKKLTSEVVFPNKDFAGKITFAKDKYITDEEAGAIYATINPNTVNFENTQLQLENSKGEASGNFALDKAVKEDNYVITRSSENGFYKLPVRYTKFNASGTSEPKANNALFALVAEYKTKKQVVDPETQETTYEEVTNKVYSKYEIVETFTQTSGIDGMTVAVADNNGKNITGTTSNSKKLFKAGGLSATLSFNKSGNTVERDIYKKYVECTNVENNKTVELKEEERQAAIAMMNGMLKDIYGRNDENFNGVKVTVDEAYSGYTFTFKYYALGYNGETKDEEFEVNFAKTSDTWDAMTFTSTPNGSGSQTVNENATEFADAPFFASDVIDEWERKVKWVRVKNTSTYGNNNAIVNAVKSVKFFETKNDKKEPAGESKTVDAGNFTVSYDLLKDKKVMQVEYNPAASGLEVGKAHSFAIEYLDANDNVVSTVDCKLTMNLPTTHEKEFSIIPTMFDGDLTIGWASYNETTGKAEYNLSNSFNNVDNTWTDAKYRFDDVTSYSDDEKNPSKTDKFIQMSINGISTVSVPTIAVENKTYSLEAGIQYYELENLWTNKKSFTLKLQSPIRHASFTFLKKVGNNLVSTDSYDIKNGDELILTDDSIKSLNYKNDAIKYLGTSRDGLIQNVTVKLADENDPNKGLIESANINGGTLSIVTKTNGAMVSNAAIKFNLVVKDKFGLETTHQFTLNVLK